MKRSKTIITLMMLGLLVIGANKEIRAGGGEDHHRFKVMVWNIWQGGKGERLPVDDARPEVIDIIRHSGADVVLMIETYGSALMISEALDYNYELLSSNLCVFSRFPITGRYLFEEHINPFNFGGVEVMIEGENPVVFFDTWLHYLPDTRQAPVNKTGEEIIAWEKEGTRDDEINAILRAIKPYLKNTAQRPVIMGGDFNSHSHLDWTESTRNMYHHGGAVVEWPISKAMTDSGMIDSYRKAHPDPVQSPGVTWLSGHDSSGGHSYTRKDRIDYLYFKGDRLKVKKSVSVVAPDGEQFKFNGKKFMFPSDHGFVLTTFELENQ